MDKMLEEQDRKLDRIIQLIEGEKDAPGLVGRLANLERVTYGDNRAMGLQTKVNIMWRLHIWLLCTLSAAAGYALKTLVSDHRLLALIWP
jgi:hypothetical protein